jgi:hypothetical protein
MTGDAGVVHDDLEPPESRNGLCDGALRLSRDREVARYVERFTDAWSRAPAARCDPSTLSNELSRYCTADAARRSRHEARAPRKFQIHGELAYRQ